MFNEYEIRVLRSYAEGLLTLLGHRARSYSSIAVREDHEALLPDAVTDDPRLLAILREQVGEEPGWLLAVVEAGFFGSITGSIRRVLATLPSTGGRVELESRRDAQEWVRVVRIYIASIVAVTDSEGDACGQKAQPTLDWLQEIAESLAAVLEGSPTYCPGEL